MYGITVWIEGARGKRTKDFRLQTEVRKLRKSLRLKDAKGERRGGSVHKQR